MGTLAEKCPYAELSVRETPDSSEYLSVLTMFWMAIETVFVSFTFSIVGI